MLEILRSGAVPGDVPALRAMLDGFAPMLNAGAPKVGATHDEVVLREGVTADVLVPASPGPHPVLVYLHGGGWVAGSPRTHRKLALRFAEAGYLVVNVDYRLAPEAPFPAPFEDCVFAVRWASERAPAYGGDPARLAIGGDSAGGNLTAAVCAALADDADVSVRAALLIYGVFDFDAMLRQPAPAGVDVEVVRRATEMMAFSYLGKEPPRALLADPRVSPLHAAAKLPPSFLVVGTADTLLAQQEALASALERHGVVHENVVYPGMPHGFLQMEFFPPALEAIGRAAAFLDRHVRGA
jgi:acetyl esterase